MLKRFTLLSACYQVTKSCWVVCLFVCYQSCRVVCLLACYQAFSLVSVIILPRTASITVRQHVTKSCCVLYQLADYHQLPCSLSISILPKVLSVICLSPCCQELLRCLSANKLPRVAVLLYCLPVRKLRRIASMSVCQVSKSYCVACPLACYHEL